MSVEIANQQRHLRVPRKQIAEIVDAVLSERDRAGALVSLAVVDNRAIRAINRTFLHRDRVTDVIAFGNPDADTPDQLIGDIVVSAERAVQEATRRSGSARGELLLYVVHGLLHVLGMDDGSPECAARMHEEALDILAKHGIRGVT